MDESNPELEKRETEVVLCGIVIVFVLVLFIVYSCYCIYRRWGRRICSSLSSKFCCNCDGQEQNNQCNATVNTVSYLVQTRFTDCPPAYVEAVGNDAYRPDTPPPSYADAVKTWYEICFFCVVQLLQCVNLCKSVCFLCLFCCRNDIIAIAQLLCFFSQAGSEFFNKNDH